MKFQSLVLGLLLFIMPSLAVAQSREELLREAVIREFNRDPILFAASFVLVVRDRVTSETLTLQQYMNITVNFFTAINSMPNQEAALEGIYNASPQIRPILGRAARAIRRLRRMRGEMAVQRLREEEELFDDEAEPMEGSEEPRGP